MFLNHVFIGQKLPKHMGQYDSVPMPLPVFIHEVSLKVALCHIKKLMT